MKIVIYLKHNKMMALKTEQPFRLMVALLLIEFLCNKIVSLHYKGLLIFFAMQLDKLIIRVTLCYDFLLLS